MNDLIAKLPEYLVYASAVVGAFASIAAVTPTPKDDGIAKMLLKAVNFLGANFGQAKNAGDQEKGAE